MSVPLVLLGRGTRYGGGVEGRVVVVNGGDNPVSLGIKRKSLVLQGVSQ